MKKIAMLGLAVAVAAATIGCSSGGGKGGSCDNVAGTWKVSGDCGSFDCVAKQDGCNIEWTCDGDEVNGSIEGSSFHLQDESGDYRCDGTSDGESASATCVDDGYTCSFTAQRLGGGGSGGYGGSSSSGGYGGSSSGGSSSSGGASSGGYGGGGICSEAGESCSVQTDCCGGTQCVDYPDLGVLCGANCTSGSHCQSGCCASVEGGEMGVCAPASYCQG